MLSYITRITLARVVKDLGYFLKGFNGLVSYKYIYVCRDNEGLRAGQESGQLISRKLTQNTPTRPAWRR